MPDPTIIIGSLNDQELKNSIDSLVRHVKEGTKAMANDFNNTIEGMKNSLKTLGDSRVSTSTSGAMKKMQSDAKQTKESYDQLASSIQKAVRTPSEMRIEPPKSARDSFYAFIEGLKQQKRELEQLVRSWENLMMHRQIGRADAVKEQIDKAKQSISEYKNAITEMRKNQPTNYRDWIKNFELAIELQKRKIKELENEYKRLNEQNPFRGMPGQEYLTRAHQRLAEVNRTLSEMTEKQQQSTTSTQQQTQAIQQQSSEIQRKVREEQQYTEEVRKSAEALRQQLMATKQSYINVGGATIYRDSEQSSIEGQLTSLVAQRTKDFKLQEEVTKAILENERAISSEVEKQRRSPRKYMTPDTWRGLDESSLIPKIIQQKLGTGTVFVNWDEQTSSIKTLNAALNQYREAYRRMTDTERNSPFGKTMISDMQVIENHIRRLEQEMRKPLSFDAIKSLPVNTIDQMSEKLRQLQAYKRGINIADPKQRYEIEEVDRAINRLQKDLNKYMQTTRQTISANDALGRSWNYMKNRLAFYFTVGATTQFVKSLIDVRGQYELLERSIGILIDSAQQGTQIFTELNAMAIKSPFTTMELGAAAKQLVAYDLAAKDVVDTTRRLADMAAAVGIPIERLTYALGQIKAYGYLNARDARMFANAGIPLVKELSDYYTKLEGQLVSTSDIYDRIKKKAISYNDVMLVVNKMTDEGGKFFNFQEKAADTLKVKIANLTLAWNNMLNEMGKDNQGVLSGVLVATKNIFERWRDINNTLLSIVSSYGLLKVAQLARLLLLQKELTTMRTLAIIQNVMGKGMANFAAVMGKGIMSLTNPATLLTASLTTIGIIIGKLVFDYMDLTKANEGFNKSISDNAEENIKSINNFFNDYKKNLEEIGGESEIEQTKMWERIGEEIEKTAKNAQQYLDILRRMPDVLDRISGAKDFLGQVQTIEKEVQRLATMRMFDLGGGFADDSLADNLIKYEGALADIRKEYGNVAKASAEYSMQSRKMIADYVSSINESRSELANFTEILSRANLDEIMGDSNDVNIRLANLREYAEIVRDNFLATEKGQKVTLEGQALLNAELDKWIAQQGVYYGLIEDRRIAEKQYTQEAIAGVEEQRTAWETLFDQLNSNDRERLDFLIETNQTGSEEFKEIWDKAAQNMEERATTSYNLIKDQIDEMRNTPDIVINVVYRAKIETETDPQRTAFEDRYIKPEGWGAMKADEYFKKREENTRKYMKYIKKEGEDNVEWEKRLGEEYQKNGKSIKSLNNQLKHSAKLSDIDREAKEKELKTLQDQNKVLAELRDAQGFDYDQFEKGKKKTKKPKKESKKDILGEAFAKEVQLIGEMQKRYKEYKSAGVDANNALILATKEYNKSLDAQSVILAKAGVNTLQAKDLAKMSLQEVRDFYEKQLEMATKLKNAKGVEALEKAIASLNSEITKIDYKKIVDGLNNELNKLKDEYELAVELDANPELGDMFNNMFNIDTSNFPKTIDQYMSMVQNEFEKRSREAKYSAKLGKENNVFKATETDWKKWAEDIGLSDEALKNFSHSFIEAQGIAKKWAQDVLKQFTDLHYKLSDVNGKVATEEKKLARMVSDYMKETNMAQKALLFLQIKDQEKAIAELKSQALSLMPEYQKVFNSAVEHSASVARKLQNDLLKIYNNASYDGSKREWTLTDSRGQTYQLSEEQYRKEMNKLTKDMRKTQSSFKKIKEAFNPSEEDGVVDYAKGIELVGEELQKLGELVNAIGNITETLGLDEKSQETITDFAKTISGLGQAAQGYAKIQNGDIIGGATDMVTGLWSSISSWFDNSNNDISREIAESEMEVKRLELAYKSLEYAIEDAYGVAKYTAQQTALANKKLQLEELKRQLRLEKARDSKYRDEEKILSLQGAILDLEHEIGNATKEITNDLLGISGVGSAVEEMITSMIDAFKNGEDYMAKYTETFDNMIDNMIMKAIVSKVIGDKFEQLWDDIESKTETRGASSQGKIDSITKDLYEVNKQITNLEDFLENGGIIPLQGTNVGNEIQQTIDELKEQRKNLEKQLKNAQREYNKSIEPTPEDVDDIRNTTETWKDEVKSSFEMWMEAFGIKFGQGSGEKNLSALQQGIQGITEDTAGALEAYMNGVSQQVYLQSDLLTQIRDVVVGMNVDVQVATIGQILLQLQASYQAQMTIQSMLGGWSSPSGQSVRVEMI